MSTKKIRYKGRVIGSGEWGIMKGKLSIWLEYLKEIQVGWQRIALHIMVNMLDGLRMFIVNVLAVNFFVRCLSDGDSRGFAVLLLFFGACNILLRAVNRWYRDFYCERADIRTERLIYRKLFEKASGVPYRQYESAEYLNRLEYLAGNAGGTYRRVMDNIGRTVSLFSTLVSVAAFLVSMDPWLLLVTAAPLLMTKVLKKQGRLRHEYELEKARNERKKAYVRRKFFFGENMDEMRTSNAYEIMDSLGRRARDDNMRLLGSYGNRLAALGFAADNLGANFSFLAGNLYAVVRMLTDRGMALSAYSVLVVSIANLNSRLSRLGREAAAYAENLLYMEDFLRFFREDAREEEAADEGCPQRVERLSVLVRKFVYPNGVPGLEDVGFGAAAGEKVVIVGENGAGKTTLLKTMLGLYPDFDGRILINGVSVRDGMGRSTFALMQDYRIYPGTIAENILLREYLPEDEEKIWAALRKVQLDERVKKMEGGIHTDIELFEGEERASFSTGERQRLALARMFAGDFDILVLDEPTAFLDPLTEDGILREIFSYAQGRLLFLVTHRLSFARRADQILYLEKGKIRERGMHEELMGKNGMYCKMFNTQRNKYFGQEGAGAI